MSLTTQYISQRAHKNLVVTTNSDTSFDSRWSEIKISGKNILGRSNHVALFFGSVMYVHGGYEADKGILSDFYSIDLANDNQQFCWKQLNNSINEMPIKLHCHSAVLYKTNIIIFGGEKETGDNNNNVYCFDIVNSSWKLLNTTGQSVPKVDSHCAFLVQNKMYVYGGYISNLAKNLTDIYILDLSQLKWTIAYKSNGGNNQPPARSNSAMIHYNNSLWVFGGTNNTKTLNDLWKFDLNLFKWQKIQSANTPQPRRGHSMIIYGDIIFVFGGIQDVTREKNDIYVYQFKSNTWNKIHTFTNSVYQCSPTLKKSKKDISGKSIDSLSMHRASPLKFSQSGDDLMKKIIMQNKQKKFLERKRELLKQFNEKHQEQKQKRRISPTTQSMMKSLKSIGDQQDNKNGVRKQIIFDESRRFIIGKKPCARNGQSIAVYNDKMYIFGGDRHLMSFNDLYQFDLGKGLKSLQLYKTK